MRVKQLIVGFALASIIGTATGLMEGVASATTLTLSPTFTGVPYAGVTANITPKATLPNQAFQDTLTFTLTGPSLAEFQFVALDAAATGGLLGHPIYNITDVQFTLNELSPASLTVGTTPITPLAFNPAAFPNFDPGPIALDAGTYELFINFHVPINDAGAYDLNVAAVSSTPLPATWAMLIAGFVGFSFFAYRGKKKHSSAIAPA
jgi:hypothetical protein